MFSSIVWTTLLSIYSYSLYLFSFCIRTGCSGDLGDLQPHFNVASMETSYFHRCGVDFSGKPRKWRPLYRILFSLAEFMGWPAI